MIHNSGALFILISALVMFLGGNAFAQQVPEDNFSTQATDTHAKPNAHKMGPKKKDYQFIIKNNPEGTLYGNACFKEVSHHFGFEYLVVPERIPPNSNNFSRKMHNFEVNVVLFFRNGPFWKSRMKKKFEKCKYGYGDFVG